MIKISHDDTLVDIIEKIQEKDSNDVILDFPIGHSILHNYISLKILKSKSEGKNLVIVTNDIIASKIGKRIGIQYSIIKDRKYIENYSPKVGNVMQYNFSIKEYIIFEINKYIKNIINSVKGAKKINSITYYYGNKDQKKTGIGIFFICVFISFLLLIFIFYFAINKTTITVSPEIIVKKSARNFIFKENDKNVLLKNNKYIEITPIGLPLTLKEEFVSTEIDVKTSQKSKGKIEIFNSLFQEVNLVPKTRIMNSSGVLFETQNWIVLPPATKDNFGKIMLGKKGVEIIAQNYDTSGVYIGSKGNIKNKSLLSLPGLTGDNIDSIYAVTIQDFSGGKDNFKRKISAIDIENAKKNLEQKLKSEVLRKIVKKVEEKNQKDKTDVAVLLIDNVVEYSDINIVIPNSISVGKIADSFLLEGSIIGKTYTYDKKELINKLKTIIKETILEGVESILLIDEDSLKVTQVLSRVQEPLEVKTTVEIDTLISYDFLNKNNSYTDKLKGSIRGLTIEDASKILLNDAKISNVAIEIRPFFLNTISNISENIYFQLKNQ